jgi:hypothetical protein
LNSKPSPRVAAGRLLKPLDAEETRLGRNDVAKLLEQTLDEEKAADKKLTAIAQSTALRVAGTRRGDGTCPIPIAPE